MSGISRTGRLRILAGIITTFLCLGLLSPIQLAVPARPAWAASAFAPVPMPVISRGVPAFASSERGRPARSANDDDYGSFWRSSSVPAWLAYDLSGVPAAQRGNVLLA